jgi:hypothetical protein
MVAAKARWFAHSLAVLGLCWHSRPEIPLYDEIPAQQRVVDLKEVDVTLHVRIPNVTSSLPRDGYMVIRDVISPQLSAQLHREAQLMFDQRVAANQLPLVAMNILYSAWLESANIKNFWGRSKISAVVAKIANASRLRLLEDAIVITHANKMAYDCWHSDWYSFGNVAADTREHAHSIWIPLVDINPLQRGGSIQLCRRQDVPANCSGVDYDAERKAEGIEGNAESWCEQRMHTSCEIPEFRAGDAVVFASDMLHRTQGLLDPGFERYALVGRFVGEGARYKPRQTSYLNYHTYKVMHDMCEHGLQRGDPIQGEAVLPQWPSF